MIVDGGEFGVNGDPTVEIRTDDVKEVSDLASTMNHTETSAEDGSMSFNLMSTVKKGVAKKMGVPTVKVNLTQPPSPLEDRYRTHRNYSGTRLEEEKVKEDTPTLLPR